MTSAKRQKAAPSALFEVVRAEGRTGDGGVPMLCLQLAGVQPFKVALRPAQILSLSAWFASQSPLASRRLREAERDRERRLPDDPTEEPTAISATGRLLAR